MTSAKQRKCLLLLASFPWTVGAFLVPSTRNSPRLVWIRRPVRPLSIGSPLHDSPTTCYAMKIRRGIEDFFDPASTFEKRQRIREQFEDLQEEDFLMARRQPAVLTHERDFFRQSTRIAAWDEYVLVSILCTSICYGALTTFTLNDDHKGIFLYESVLKTIIQIVAGTGVLAGLYSTMVFSLSILYGKTALGLERDVQYDEYLDDTADIRSTAFLAFSAALALFAVLVVLVLAEDLPLVLHLPVGSVLVTALYAGFRDWKTLVEKAEDIYDYLDDYDDHDDDD